MKSLKKHVFDLLWACGGLLWLYLAVKDVIYTITANSRTGWPLEFALAVNGAIWLGILAAMILLYRVIRKSISCLQGYHKEKPPEMDGFNYFPYSPRPEGGSLGYSSSSKLSNGPLRPERWSLVYSTFSSTSLSISFLACAEGSAE